MAKKQLLKRAARAMDRVKLFGRVVRQIREGHRLSQEALAAKANLNRCYLGELERGCLVEVVLVVFRATARVAPTIG